MADEQELQRTGGEGTPWYTTLYREARHLAMGEHRSSKYISPLLLLFDALLCSLIISKVPCTFHAQLSL
jgi:alpha-1,3-mannosyltransferase